MVLAWIFLCVIIEHLLEVVILGFANQDDR